MAERLRIHAIEPRSRANGPGVRAVLWLRGCTLGCRGCFNPETHAFAPSDLWTVDDLAERLLALRPGVEGVTISGGEPLQQPRALSDLLRRLRQVSDLSVLLFSGYGWEEIVSNPVRAALLPHVDVLLAGRYEEKKRLASGLRGSANKTLHFLTSRYGPEDLATVPEAEVIIAADGTIRLSGIEPLQWPAALDDRTGS